MSDELLKLTAAATADQVRRGELDPAELFETYRERAAADELNAFTWVNTFSAVAAGTPRDTAPVRNSSQNPPINSRLRRRLMERAA